MQKSQKYLKLTKKQKENLPDDLILIKSSKTGKYYLPLGQLKTENNEDSKKQISALKILSGLGTWEVEMQSNHYNFETLISLAHQIKNDFFQTNNSKNIPRYV